MKYLIKRNDFLRDAKRLDEKSEFLRDSKIAGNQLYQDLVKEEIDNSGPMANDIGWNDSLVGRFLNHLIRKAKVANNLRRIKGVIKSLEGEFVRIEAQGLAYNMSEDEKKLYLRVILYTFLSQLKESVERGDETKTIIALTESAIKNINDIKGDSVDEATKEKIVAELEAFLEFLKGLKEEPQEQAQGQGQGQAQGQGQGEEGSEEDDEEDDEEEEEDDSQSRLKSSVPTMIKNLSALYNILIKYQKVVPKLSTALQNQAKSSTFVTNGGETIESIQKDPQLNKKNLTTAQIIAKNAAELKPTLDAAAKKNTAKEKAILPKDLSLVLESQADARSLRILEEAFGKLKVDLNSLVDSKDSKLPISAEFVRILLAKHKDGKNDSLIIALYDNINKYLVGNKKATIQEKNPLYKESYEYLMPKVEKNPKGGKIEVVAEKIARFSKRALQFDGKNLYSGLGELGDPLKKFVETMKVLMKNPIINVKPEYSEQSAEKKKEKYEVGKKYIQTKENGEKKVVTLVSKTHVMTMGDDKKWATKDDGQGGELPNSQDVSVVDDKSTISYGVSRSKLSPYVDQKAKETKYKKDELIKNIESATKKALELRKDSPKKAEKIQANIDKMKSDLDKLDESVSESAYISKYLMIESGIQSIMQELNMALSNSFSSDRRLLKFDRFMSYIKEADGDGTGSPTPENPEKEADGDGGSTTTPEKNPETEAAGDPRSGMSRSEKIQDWFDKNCMTVKEYTIEKSEFGKVKANFEKMQSEKDGFIIDGYDPVIEILKLFNRAYKLYTSQYISKRTNFNPEGGIGVSTGAEYTSFGGSDNKGPYRNNKIFDAWESAVLDIMKDRKYQFIFDKKTKLRVGDELRPNGGANLRKFMTDMLDGESLYKSKSGFSSEGKGAQANLLDKYFGEADDKGAAAIIKEEGTPESKENAVIAGKILENAIKIKTTKIDSSLSPVDERKAVFPIPDSFVVIKGKNKDGDEIQRSFFLCHKESDMQYMQYSPSFFSFKTYIDGITHGVKVEMLSGEINLKNDTQAKTYYTKVKEREFTDLILKPGKISIGRLDNDGNEDIEIITIGVAYWVTKEKDGKPIVFDIIQKGAEQGKDNAKREQLKAAILKRGNKTDIVNRIGTRKDVVIKKVS